MSFYREVGALISESGNFLKMVYGTASVVDIPQTLLWELHKARPGFVSAFVHTHPPGMVDLSRIDISTLKAWSLALYPFPLKMGVITTDAYCNKPFLNLYHADLQSKDEWIKGTERKFEVIKTIDEATNHQWIDFLWKLSCKHD